MRNWPQERLLYCRGPTEGVRNGIMTLELLVPGGVLSSPDCSPPGTFNADKLITLKMSYLSLQNCFADPVSSTKTNKGHNIVREKLFSE